METFFKNHCESCGGGIEFPANGVGEEIPCPHCQQNLTLSFPEDSDGTATKQIDTFLAASSFPTKRAELVLLSHFGCIRPVKELLAQEMCANYLGANPKAIVDRFVSEGLLEECNSDLTLLLLTKSSSDLKAMATARGIPRSGSKATLARRLLDADPVRMAELFRGKSYLMLSTKGAIIVEKFEESEKEIQRQAKQDTLAAMGAVRLQSMKEAGIIRVRVLGSPGTCPTCQSESGKVYPIDAAPVLPHEGCTCRMGCVCVLVANE